MMELKSFIFSDKKVLLDKAINSLCLSNKMLQFDEEKSIIKKKKKILSFDFQVLNTFLMLFFYTKLFLHLTEKDKQSLY